MSAHSHAHEGHDHDHEDGHNHAGHDHGHEHHHGLGGHHHAPANFGQAFAIGIALNLSRFRLLDQRCGSAIRCRR
jgi:cobalt-zinc-cadmium efflux system protein